MSREHSKIDLTIIIFSAFMLIKLILAMTAVPLIEKWGGDAPDYIGKARYFYDHTSFPEIKPLSSTEKVLICPDFRPPGYSIFLSSFYVFGETNKELSRSVRLAQFFLDFTTTALILFVAYHFKDTQGFRILAAVILGIQPWTSAYITSIVPDTLTAFFFVSGLISLALFISNKTIILKVLTIVAGSLLLSLTFIIRPEMIVFAMFINILALMIASSSLSWRSMSLYGLLAAIPFIAIVGANMAYRWHVEHKIAIFGDFPNHTPGLGKWSQTWVGPQTVKEKVVFGPLMINMEDFAALPDHVFSSPEERLNMIEVVRQIKAKGYMTADDDSVFMTVAQERIKRDPLTYYLWNRLYSSTNFWVNLSNATHYLYGFSFLPRPLSMALTISFFIFKIAIFCFFILGVYFLLRKFPSGIIEKWVLAFLWLGVAFVIARTLFFGLYLNYVEYRYTIVAWPSVLATALFGLSTLWPAVQERRGIGRPESADEE